MDAFSKLPKSSQILHLCSLMLIAATIVCLMAPAAFHRLVERGEDTDRMHHFASRMLICAMVPLALGIAIDCYVIVAKVLDSVPVAIGMAALTLLFFYGLWFGLTLAVRARSASSPVVNSARRRSAA